MPEFTDEDREKLHAGMDGYAAEVRKIAARMRGRRRKMMVAMEEDDDDA